MKIKRELDKKKIEQSQYLTSAELAAYLKVSVNLIHRNAYRIAGSFLAGRCRRFDLDKVKENVRKYNTIFKIES